jgi:hypothetical protein
MPQSQHTGRIRVVYIEDDERLTTGGSTPYVVEATANTQFDIFVPSSTPANANLNKWHIEWIAIGN